MLPVFLCRLPLKVLTLVAFIGLVACQSPSKQLIGEWSIDSEALERSLHKLKIAPPAAPIVKSWKVNMTRDWAFRFNPDMSLEVAMHGAQYRGRYQISKVIGRTVFLRAELKSVPVSELDALLGISQEVSKIKVQHLSMRISDDQSTLMIDDLPPLILRRVST